MFNKLKARLRLKLRLYLGISSLEENFTNYRNNNDYTLTQLDNKLYSHSKSISRNKESIDILHNTIESVVHIGTDVRENHYNREDSWAVVCIEGKINIVKFVPLERKNARDILDFLKHFEGGGHCIDTPHKDFFYDGLWKF